MTGKSLPTRAEIRAWTDREVVDAMQRKDSFGLAWLKLRSAIAAAEQAEMQRQKPTIIEARKTEALAMVAIIEAWHNLPTTD